MCDSLIIAYMIIMVVNGCGPEDTFRVPAPLRGTTARQRLTLSVWRYLQSRIHLLLTLNELVPFGLWVISIFSVAFVAIYSPRSM